MLKGPNRYLFTYAIHIFIKSFAHTNSASWYVAASRCLILSLVQTFGGLRSNITDSTFDIFRGLPNPPYCAWLRLPPFCLRYSISSYNPPSPHTRTPGEGQAAVCLIPSQCGQLLASPASVLRRSELWTTRAEGVGRSWGHVAASQPWWQLRGPCWGLLRPGPRGWPVNCREAHRGQHQSVSPLQC